MYVPKLEQQVDANDNQARMTVTVTVTGTVTGTVARGLLNRDCF